MAADLPHRDPLDEPGPQDAASREFDPLERLAANNRSSKQAWTWALSMLALAFLSGALIAFTSHLIGGPLCEDSFQASWQPYTCSVAMEWAFGFVPFGIMVISTLGGALGTWWKWRNFLRWRPWLASLWMTVPATLAIGSITAYVFVRLVQLS